MQTLKREGNGVQNKVQKLKLLAASQKKASHLKQHVEISKSVLSDASTVYATSAGSVLGSDGLAAAVRSSFMGPDVRKYSVMEAWRRDDAIGDGATGNFIKLGIHLWLIFLDSSGKSFGSSISGKRFALALQNLQEEKYSSAESLLKTTIANANLPEHQLYEANLALALCYKGQERYSDAERVILRLLESKDLETQKAKLDHYMTEIQVANFNAKVASALKLKEQGDYSAASEKLLGLLKTKDISESQKAHLNYSAVETYSAQSKAEEALPYALKACEIFHSRQQDHLYYDSCRLLARLHRSLGDHAEASIYMAEIPFEHHYGGRVYCRKFLEFEYPVPYAMAILLSPRDDLLAIRVFSSDHSSQGKLFFWTESRGLQSLGTQPGHVPSSPCFSPDGQKFFSANKENIKLWNLSKEPHFLEKTFDRKEVTCLAASPDGQILVTGHSSGKMYHWDLVREVFSMSRINLRSKLSSLLFTPNGKILAVDVEGKGVRLLSFPAYRSICCLEDIRCLSFSADSTLLAGVKRGRTVDILDTRTGSTLRTLKGHMNQISNVSFSPDGKIMASSSVDHRIKLWESATGKLLQTIDQSYSTYHNGLCFSPNGNLLASAGTNDYVTIWKIEY